MGYSSGGHKESDTTEQLSTYLLSIQNKIFKSFRIISKRVILVNMKVFVNSFLLLN